MNGVAEYYLVFSRITLLFVFLISSLGKLQDVQGFVQAINSFRIVPGRFAQIAAILFLGGELLVIVFLGISGAYLDWGFGLAMFLLIIFSMALSSVLIRRIETSCNCFGASQKRVSAYDVWRNGIFFFISLGGLGAVPAVVNQINIHLIEAILISIVSAVIVIVLINLNELIEVLR